MRNKGCSCLVFYILIIIGKSYYINTIVTIDERKHLQGVRPCETIDDMGEIKCLQGVRPCETTEDIVRERHKRMSKYRI